MKAHDVFWKLETLSDRQLLEQLGSVLGSSRRLMAELLAHLGEVEERRLHLVAACSSMFAYCLKLGMTEDEAYRRIEAARLARRYSAIFPLLATGQLTISALALLKHHLSDDNHLELLAEVAGKSVVQTRELIAARFPRPDVSSSVRKLPERRAVMQPTLSMSTPTEPPSGGTVRRTVGTEPCASETESCFTSSVTGSIEAARPGAAWAVGAGGSMSVAPAIKSTPGRNPETPAPPVQPERGAPAPLSSRIEPLSAHRYKVQFTAGAELARKLELARDLMRHAHPGGELGPIVERALDLLIESLMQRRFGKKASPKRTSGCAVRTDPDQRGEVMGEPSTMRCTAKADTAKVATTTTLVTVGPATTTFADATAHDTRTHDTGTLPVANLGSATFGSVGFGTATLVTATFGTATPVTATFGTATPVTADVPGDHCGELTRPSVSSNIPRSARRIVVERDGLGCSWVDERGVRCDSRSWLEYDHRRPRAKGGGSEPHNLRLLCRSHNRFAAEREYGREHVEHAVSERRRHRAPHAM